MKLNTSANFGRGGERGGLKETLRKGARIKSLLFFSLYILLSLVRWRSSTSRQSLVQSLEQNIVKFNLYLKKIYLSLSFHAFRNFPHLVIVCLSKLIRGIFHFLLVFFFFSSTWNVILFYVCVFSFLNVRTCFYIVKSRNSNSFILKLLL